jgi:hypothetical protein
MTTTLPYKNWDISTRRYERDNPKKQRQRYNEVKVSELENNYEKKPEKLLFLNKLSDLKDYYCDFYFKKLLNEDTIDRLKFQKTEQKESNIPFYINAFSELKDLYYDSSNNLLKKSESKDILLRQRTIDRLKLYKTEKDENFDSVINNILDMYDETKKLIFEERIFCALASEKSLAKDWLKPEEDETWAHL